MGILVIVQTIQPAIVVAVHLNDFMDPIDAGLGDLLSVFFLAKYDFANYNNWHDLQTNIQDLHSRNIQGYHLCCKK